MDLLQFAFDPILSDVPQDWQEKLLPYLQDAEVRALSDALQKRISSGEVIFPPRECIFNALKHTPFNKVKGVIIGQDPYHEPGEAIGMAFAVPKTSKMPPSLRNIFKEYASDLQKPIPTDTTLAAWADHGVLLLNTVLTVSAHQAGSHRNIGWEQFTKAVIQAVSSKQEPVAFLLFGSDAIRQKAFIDSERHVVVETVHPSPLSAYRGFFGSRPFSSVNQMLQARGAEEIDWILE